MNKYIQSVLEFFYDIISIPVFLFHFLGIPFIWAEISSHIFIFMAASQNLSRGIAVLVFAIFIVHRVFKAIGWEYEYEMPRWLKWFNHDLRNKVLQKNKK
ncbi:MAG: hypothetical protein KBD26_01965 [Candidatus Pacebacteria bacterium]|nr:hypothetical protein [Candidatus Paceibacterota bacterium]MBP9772577.1 hypothetical protein [Candidatus Paceibacterota bacterium]